MNVSTAEYPPSQCTPQQTGVLLKSVRKVKLLLENACVKKSWHGCAEGVVFNEGIGRQIRDTAVPTFPISFCFSARASCDLAPTHSVGALEKCAESVRSRAD